MQVFFPRLYWPGLERGRATTPNFLSLPRDLFLFLFFFFSFFSLHFSVWLCVSLGVFVCWVLLSPFVLGFYLSIFFVCFHLFDFLFFFLFLNSFLTIYFFCLSFSFSSLLCGLSSLGATVRGQAWSSKVGNPSPGWWTTRELLTPWNINQWELSQTLPTQH